jgi:hypothetical protein
MVVLERVRKWVECELWWRERWVRVRGLKREVSRCRLVEWVKVRWVRVPPWTEERSRKVEGVREAVERLDAVRC